MSVSMSRGPGTNFPISSRESRRISGTSPLLPGSPGRRRWNSTHQGGTMTSVTATAAGTTTPTTSVRVGLALSIILGLANLPFLFLDVDWGADKPPFALLLLNAALGMVSVVCAAIAWNSGNRLAIRINAAALIINTHHDRARAVPRGTCLDPGPQRGHDRPHRDRHRAHDAAQVGTRPRDRLKAQIDERNPRRSGLRTPRRGFRGSCVRAIDGRAPLHQQRWRWEPSYFGLCCVDGSPGPSSAPITAGSVPAPGPSSGTPCPAPRTAATPTAR